MGEGLLYDTAMKIQIEIGHTSGCQGLSLSLIFLLLLYNKTLMATPFNLKVG